MRIQTLFLSAAILCLPVEKAPAYYVTKTGNDLNTGLSEAQAFATINHAVTLVNAGGGTEVWIGPGTWLETFQITRSGTAITPITICALNSNTSPPDVTITSVTANPVVSGNSVSNVIFRCLGVTGSTTLNNGQQEGIAFIGHNDLYPSNMVDHCWVRNTGIGIYWGAGLALSDNKGFYGGITRSNIVNDCTAFGIHARPDASFGSIVKSYRYNVNSQYLWNLCSNCTGNATGQAGGGMFLEFMDTPYVYGQTSISNGFGNLNTGSIGGEGIEIGPTRGGYVGQFWAESTKGSVTGFDGGGINSGVAADNMLWEHGYVVNNNGQGCLTDAETLDGGNSNEFRFIVFVNNSSVNHAVWTMNGFTAHAPYSNSMHHCTLVNYKATASSLGMVLFDTGSHGDNGFWNNVIITSNRNLVQVVGNTTPLRINGNYYLDLDGTPNFSFNSTTYNSLAAWQGASGQDAGSSILGSNPLKNPLVALNYPGNLSFAFTNYDPLPGQLGTGIDGGRDYGVPTGGFDFHSNSIVNPIFVGAIQSTFSDPLINQNPQSVAVFVNSSTNFTVVASGTPTLHYQWKVNGANQGTDSATFTTNTVLAGAQGATVSVVVTGPGAQSPVMSADAIIQILPDPYIQIEPTNYTTVEGGSATFFVGAIGATTLTYAWTVGGISQGGNSPTLTLNNVPFLFNGSAVVCAVSDSNGSTNTIAATLTVNHNGPLPPYTGDAVNFTIVSALRTNGVGPVQGWIDYDVSFYPITELNTNFDATRAYGEIAWFTFPISTSGGQPFGPQTYKIYIGQATQTTNSTVIARIGDGWVTNTFGPTDSWNTWTNLPNVTSTISFSNVLIGFMKRQPVGTLQNYWLAGVGVLQTNYDTISPGVYRFINTNAIVTTNLAGAPGNLVPNSSFEFGLAPGGWTSGRNGTIGNETWLANMTTNDAFNGSKAAVIGDGLNASRFQIISPPIWLRGDRNIRSYVLSFYYKKGPGGPASATVDWSRPYAGADSGAANFSPSGSYQRFQTNLWLAPFPNRLFQFAISQGTSGPLMIDAVQFEESTNGATAYAPANQIELAIACRDINSSTWHNGNVVDSISMTPGFGFQVYNNTANSSNVVGHINIYDWLNRNVGVGTFNHTAAPGLTEFYSGTFTAAGENRIYAYLDGSPAFRTEADFAFVPVPNPVTTNWASMFGTHACQNNDLIASNLTWGIPWQRGLSPGGIVQMNEIEAVSNVFNFASTDIKVNAALQGGKCVLLANMSDVSDIPAWALDGSGVPFLQPLSNFAYQVVNHYKAQIHHWESINEPMTPSGWSGATFATIETALSGAVKLADPTAIYVGFGGTGGGTDISKPETAWTAMSAGTHAQIDAISVHMYPANSALWMGPDDDPGPAAARALGIFCGKPVWNTESGSFHWPNHGDKNGGLQGIPSYANHNEEFQYRRSVYQAAELAARNWIRLLGYGVQKYFYYDGRLANAGTFNGGISGGAYASESLTGPTWFDYDDSMGPVGTAYLWSQHFLDLPSYVQSMTNTATSDVFGALFAHNGGQQVIAAFTLSRSNLVMTVTNNSFAVYDMMGGLLQTNVSVVAIGRTPTYWVSSDLTSNQLTATFQSASVVASVNMAAPAISIDVSQHGNILQTNQLPFRFRWTTISPYDINTDDTPLIVLTRYRFAGITDWTSWSADRYVEMTNAPSTLTHLEVQAMDAQGNLSGTVSGPDFGPGTGPIAPYNFHVSKGHVSSGHL